MNITTSRIYEEANAQGGVRVLVDRLWPRGVSKERADLDLWAKNAAPSTELRHRWHEVGAADTPEGRHELAEALRAELSHGAGREAFDQLVEFVRNQASVTLLTGAKDVEHSHLPVIRALVAERLAGE